MKSSNTNQQIAVIDRVSTNNTAHVVIKVKVMNTKYHKMYSVTHRRLVDTNNLKVKIGDSVAIASCRPLSKLKSWKITEVIK